jgi:hypothetical protein
MGFLDKAKKMAEQAQTKLDEVQKQFSEQKSSSSSSSAPVEYDKHGRPIRSEAPPAASTPPHGDPVAEQPSSPPPPPATAPTPDPAAPAPPRPDAPEGAEEDRDDPGYAPPKLTGGDPLS